ncbi:MAG: hypothetical protein AB7I13_14595 [Vicinamibacterales bacterium]
MSPRLSVRPATRADLPQILELVATQPFMHPLTRRQIAAMHSAPWQGSDEPVGFVIVDQEGRVGGTLHCTYSPPRHLNGITYRTSTLSHLYVAPGFQFERDRARGCVIRWGVELTKAAMALPMVSLSFSARGPNDVAARMLDGELGFERMSTAEVFTCAPATIPVPDRVDETRLSPDHRGYLAHHLPLGCRALTVDGCLVISKRTHRYRLGVLVPRAPWGRSRHVPVTEILYLSDAAQVEPRPVWRALVARLCLRDRTIGVITPESFFDLRVPEGVRVPQVLRAFRRGDIPRYAIDKLYAEPVLLP